VATTDDALSNWTLTRSLRKLGMEELPQVWQQALEDKTPSFPVDDIFYRLEQKYQNLNELNR
jgi:antitoxin ParD1/3/4